MGRYELFLVPHLTPLCRFQASHTFLSGYNAPRNLQNYALYLDTRIRSYRDLKHDAIRVQSETNRDIRLSMSIEEDARHSRKYTPEEDRFQPSSDSSKRKTIMGRKLRIMTVEKGLLRETKVVQKMMDALIECKVSFNICLLFGDPLPGKLMQFYSALPGRLGGSIIPHCAPDADQGPAHPFPSR